MLRKKSQARRGKSQSQRRYSILGISSLFFRGNIQKNPYKKNLIYWFSINYLLNLMTLTSRWQKKCTFAVVARVDKVLESSNFGNMPPRCTQAGDSTADNRVKKERYVRNYYIGRNMKKTLNILLMLLFLFFSCDNLSDGTAVMTLYARRQFCADFEVYRQPEPLWTPRLREAATTL